MVATGRVTLITGGGKGIGAAIAVRLAAEGANIALLGRDAAALRQVAETIGQDGRGQDAKGQGGGKALAIVADVTDAEAMDRAVAEVEEKLGPIDVLVANAGIAAPLALHATDDATWDRTFAVNVTSPFRLARALLPKMAKRGWGRIINIASNAGLSGYAYTSAYCASKHALVGLTRSLAIEFARSGVTVNAVCPGFVDTEMATRAAENIAAKTKRDPDEARKALEALSPQRRLMTSEEVAHVVAMLVSDAARGINGQAIAIDGGQTMR